ncbi:hypothetical protein MMC07_001895 [Pseudocyphellaria aurata]|nr:hypothetical protein [Pseudocyphellaria aurata]
MVLARRLGLNKADYKLESLHPNAGKLSTKQPERDFDSDSEENIFGPPESDDESQEEGERQSTSMSSLTNRKSSNASVGSLKANGLNVRSLSHQSTSPPGELSNPASIIPPSSWRKGTGKRNSTMTSGDISEEDCFPTAKKRPKKTNTYTRQSTTLDTSPKTGKVNKGKTKGNSSSPAGKKSAPKFRTVDTQSMISKVDEMEQRDFKKLAFKPPLQLETSPRAERASNRSRNLEKTKKETINDFKIPDQIQTPEFISTSEDACHKFVMPFILPDSPNTLATKSKQPSKEPDSILTVGYMKGVLETVQNKLNMPDIHPPPQTSSVASSSIPSSFNDTTSSSPISSPPSSPEIDALIHNVQFERANIPYFREPPTMAKCPICKKAVERDFLEDFENAARLNVRQQLRFCKAHRARTADAEWEAKGYPKIDWQHFDQRLARFHGDLDEILRGKKPSFYRNAFEDHVKSGQNRTLHQTMMSGSSMEGLLPGYYGSRGAKLMMENIMIHFARKLRNLAASNKLLSSGGVSGYVQAVLVPELAVLLVMQDMGTDEEGARAILRDSIDIGYLLNEEEDEVINDPDPEAVAEV